MTDRTTLVFPPNSISKLSWKNIKADAGDGFDPELYKNNTAELRIPPEDPYYDAFKRVSAFLTIPVTQESGGLNDLTYSIENVKNHMKFKYQKVDTWDTMLSYAKFFILNANSRPDELLAFSRFMAAQVLSTDGTQRLDDIYTFPEGVVPSQEGSVSLPAAPTGFSDFNELRGTYREGIEGITAITVAQAPYVLPVIFFNFLRCKMNVSPENGKNRLRKIKKLFNLYEGMNDIMFILPPSHYWETYFTRDQSAGPADIDLLTKAIMWRTKSDSTLERICNALIGQNAYLWGLTHYNSYIRIGRHLTVNRADELSECLRHPMFMNEYNSFVDLCLFAQKMKDSNDRIWCCSRIINPRFLTKWSPRNLKFITLTLAYIETQLKLTDGNDSYSGFLKQDRVQGSSLPIDQLNFCGKWIAKWYRDASAQAKGRQAPDDDVDSDIDPE